MDGRPTWRTRLLRRLASATHRTWRARFVQVSLWTITVINALLGVLLVLASTLPLPERDARWSQVVEYRDGRPAYVFLSPDDKWRLHVTLDRVDPRMIEALVALEDQRFWSHDGVDPIAIARAAWTDLIHLRRVSGGSTITMQLARLLEPRRRTIPNKLIDMFRATQLDLRMSKHEILEEYLSRTPYGGNVEGIESASWSYFGHGARHLTPLEIATLLAVPQGPARFAPRPENEPRLRARRDAILEKLIAAGVFTGADADTARVEAAAIGAPDRLKPMPRDAPHAAFSLRRRYRNRMNIRSTLEAGAQALVEREVALRAPELRGKGIFNGAVVVLDHRTREVVALAGSLDFHEAAHGGQIAMFERPRSPGSTLKPFLYAIAIDRGLMLPEYLVPDVPTLYGTYRPKNFDGDWAGLVTMKDALSRSLNIPFVDLLQQVGVETFVAELGRLGIAQSRIMPGTYGLSLIVGGIELTPLELAGMYATIAGDGTFRAVKLVIDTPQRSALLRAPPEAGLADPPAQRSALLRAPPEAGLADPPQRSADPADAGTPIFGAGAAYLTRQTLALKDRPDFPRRRAAHGLPPEIHWKTGTSFGFRDAWAVGSGPEYTAVVWAGNADNTSSAELVGSEAAGPLLFDILEGLTDRSRKPVPPTPPADLTTVEICAFSGHLATAACDKRTTALAPVHAVPTKADPYMQAYDVDRATGRAVLPACRDPQRAYDRKTFIVLPSAVTAWLVERHRAVPPAPVFADGCVADTNIAPPAILTPAEGAIVTLIPGVPAKNQMVALSVSTRAATVSWFVDGALLGTVPASERIYWMPSPGKHELVVADDTGKKARRTLHVKAGLLH